jgi:hypothetical protein
MGNFVDLTGKRFGRLTVIKHCGFNHHHKALRKCVCDCGGETLSTTGNLNQEISRSCGCLMRESASERAAERNWKHGHAVRGKLSSEYRSFTAMHKRCSYPSSKKLKNYGGRGISICARWQSFETFLADMGPKPTPNHSIDRWPDVDGNYEPNNCRLGD